MNKIGAVLVVGGGIGGIQASLDLAESGFKVYLLEREPSIGGVMPKLDKTFPTNDCSICILSPKLVECGRHQNIELITYGELEEVEGGPGNFRVKIRTFPRYVDIDRCVGCGVCVDGCPTKVKDSFNEGLNERKAIYVLYPQAVPLSYTIDKDNCLYLTKGRCGLCKKVCKREAIDFEDKGKVIELYVGSIILSTGFKGFDPKTRYEYGYGRYRNVVTSLEFERILSASGPFGGRLKRPSDGREPARIAWIQCVGSRDLKIENPYCSTVCCTYAVKEAIIAKEHARNNLDTTIFYMDLRTFGKGFEEYYNRAIDEYKVRFIRSRISFIKEDDKDKGLWIRYIANGGVGFEKFDMVILSIGMCPSKGIEDLVDRLGISLNEYGFWETRGFSQIETIKEGIFVSGASQAPKDIPETIAQASGASVMASSILSEARNTLITKRIYPQEKDVQGEEVRVGVFICDCGVNIGSIVDTEELTRYAGSIKGVVLSKRNLFTCSQDTQEEIKRAIKEYGLNRVVIAACSPRTHEPIFQETIRQAGLNPYLLEMANIRDQCSWVHMDLPPEATKKANTLVRMAISKVILHEPLKRERIKVTKRCLVIGGGVSGMVSSLSLAEQGFDVFLVEREGELGGNLRHIHYSLNGKDPQGFLHSLIKKVEGNEKISVYKNSEIKEVTGFIGNFTSTIITNHKSLITIEHGAIIVATGGEEYKPYGEYLYGEDKRVVTQLEFEERFKDLTTPPLRSVVIVNCVGSRIPSRPYCSRICCEASIRHALRLKGLNKRTEIYILYKDMRTYGFMEGFYMKARELGVIFIRYEKEPSIFCKEKGLCVDVMDNVLERTLRITPDLIILNTAILPSKGNETLSTLLRIPLDGNGFFLEAHPKLRPLDSLHSGVFICGISHSPRLIEESISQALGVAQRASIILSRDELETEGITSVVDQDRCIKCLTCIRVCPYEVPFIDEEGILKIEAVKCQGCGTCAGACPAKAIQLMHYTDPQILAKSSISKI